MNPSRSASPSSRALAILLIAAVSTSVACTARRPVSGPVHSEPSAEAPAPDAQEPTPDAAVAVTTAEASDETHDVDAGQESATGDRQSQRGPGVQVRRRAEAGVEAMIIGTVVGGQIGSVYGAAIGAALFGVYGFVTGDVPFDSGRGNPGPTGRRRNENADQAMEREIEEELERQEALESEIEAELRRQEQLLAAISKQEEVNTVRDQVDECDSTGVSTDTMASPEPPCERKIPDSIFDKSVRKEGRQERLIKTLDADRDGRPELEIVIDAKDGTILTRAEDTDYDGILDAHTSYQSDGQVKARQEDSNGDGLPDRWIVYQNGKGTRVEVDRDYDGKRDGFYVYEDGTLTYEEHDTNGDGRVDRRVNYEGKRRVVELEDSNHNGQMDSSTFFGDDGIPVRNERDTNGDGKTDIWEHYEGRDAAKIVLARKEEDMNHDGRVDVTSHYKKGKLVRKDIDDPDLVE
ncbi:MAG: hypothetical protein GY725_25620 [bacterium]|nr:hypothetical protein [bacterium]